MKTMMGCFAAFLVTALCASCAHYNTFPPGASAKADEPADLKILIDRGHTAGAGEYRIVDVRPPKKFSEGHIPTAVNVPNGKVEGLEEPPPTDKLIIVYCETGGRAQMAAKKLAKAGYDNVYNWGGFTDWPFETETSPLPDPVKKETADEGEKEEKKSKKKDKKEKEKKAAEDEPAEGDSLEDLAAPEDEPSEKSSGDGLDGLF